MLQRLTYRRLKLIFPPTACVQRYSQLLSEAQHFVSIPNIEIAWSGHEHNGQFAGSILLERHHADSNEAAFGFNEGQGDRIKVARGSSIPLMQLPWLPRSGDVPNGQVCSE